MTCLLVVGLLLATPLLAATDVPCDGSLINDHWTLDGSPYLVNCDIEIASLVIDPGVEVLATGNYQISVVNGVIEAVGTEDLPIVFSRAEAVSDWKGLRLINAASQSELAHCVIERSTRYGLYMETAEGAMPHIHHCRIANNVNDNHPGEPPTRWVTASAGGVYVVGDMVFEDCIVEDNFTATSYSNEDGSICRGGGVCADGTLTLVRCRVRGNTAMSHAGYGELSYARGGGVHVAGSLILDNTIITGNHAVAYSQGGSENANGGGVYVCGDLICKNSVIAGNQVTAQHWPRGGGIYHDCGEVTIEHTTIADNEQQGVYACGTSQSSIIHNSIIWNNETSTSCVDEVTYTCIEGGFEGAGNISCTPIFDDEYRILPGSCCIDAGDPAPEWDDACFGPSQGTLRADMGWTGGPDAYLHDRCCIAVEDVSGDQGDHLTVTWPAFTGEADGSVVSYRVERSHLGFEWPYDDWVEVTTIAADQSASYTVEATVDSTYVVDESWPFYVFRVVGEGDGDPQLSNTNRGLAVDDIAPPPPGLSLSESGAGRLLIVDPSGMDTVSDFGQICVFRGGWNRPGQTFFPIEATLWDEASLDQNCTTIITACTDMIAAPTIFWECHLNHFYYLARCMDVHGNWSADTDSLYSEFPTDVDDLPAPVATRLHQNRPNPFNPATTIEYTLAAPGPVEVAVYDLGGRLVRTLVAEERQEQGNHRVTWRGRDQHDRAVASGTYVCLMRAGDRVESRRMVLLR
jgi:hypothetical protein